jgi:hypothetical protein
MKAKIFSRKLKKSKPEPGQMGDPNRAVRSRKNASRKLADKDVPGDRGAGEKKSQVQGSE